MACKHENEISWTEWQQYGSPRPGDGALCYRELRVRHCNDCNTTLSTQQTGGVKVE